MVLFGVVDFSRSAKKFLKLDSELEVDTCDVVGGTDSNDGVDVGGGNIGIDGDDWNIM